MSCPFFKSLASLSGTSNSNFIGLVCCKETRRSAFETKAPSLSCLKPTLPEKGANIFVFSIPTSVTRISAFTRLRLVTNLSYSSCVIPSISNKAFALFTSRSENCSLTFNFANCASRSSLSSSANKAPLRTVPPSLKYIFSNLPARSGLISTVSLAKRFPVAKMLNVNSCPVAIV